MEGERKLIITCLLIFIFCCSLLKAQQTGDTYWYVNGEKYYWHYQEDVYAFRYVSQEACEKNMDADYVDYKFFRGEHRDKINILYFHEDISNSALEAIKREIEFDNDFETKFPVITLFPDEPYSGAKWFVADDLLLVNFSPQKLDEKSFYNFKEKYHLSLINFPDSNSLVNAIHTYIFKYDVEDNWPLNAIDLSRKIFEENTELVTNVQPNLINAYREVSDDVRTLNTGSNLEQIKKNMEYYLVNNYESFVKVFVNMKEGNLYPNIKIYDTFGREVYKYEADNVKVLHEIDITDYVSGYYFSSVETENGEVLGVQKFQKL